MASFWRQCLVIVSGFPTAYSAVLSEDLDAQVARMNTEIEEAWERARNFSADLQKQRPAGLSVGGVPSLNGPQASLPPAMAQKLTALEGLQREFHPIQETAFRMSRESRNNAELVSHSELNNYLHELRSFHSRFLAAVDDAEKLYLTTTGQPAQNKKRKKARKKSDAISMEDIRKSVSRANAEDSRHFRSKAMSAVSLFNERQLEMQDKQKDMRRAMDGPDWPTEDWPLTSKDSTLVGDLETMMDKAQVHLNEKIQPIGGLGRVHESGDEESLERLLVLGEVMRHYVEVMDRYVDTVKSVQRKKRQQSKRTTGTGKGAQPQDGKESPVGESSSLRDSLLNFGRSSSLRDSLLNFGNLKFGAGGSGGGAQQPFGSLRDGLGVPGHRTDL
eukprot:TRINITY_DN18677_c0_g1_i1.p1 TRINITY_DN18677_c0_g1~~TRINITY_DN18677_c0_g1_i1.p1  ORF type:complete len:388 (+),score=58.30 TRINITY_DN18677_c0_g1_i1:45-1208(+)